MRPREPGTVTRLSVATAAVAAAQFGLVGLGVLAPELQAEFGVSRSQMGMIPSLVFLGCVVTSLPAGRLTDSKGAAGVLGVSLVGCAAGLGLAAAAPSFTALVGALVVIGLALGGINPATNAVVAGGLGSRLGFFMSIKQSGVPLGGLVAGVALPPIAVALGWRTALVAPVGAILLAVTLIPLLHGMTVSRGGREGRPSSQRRFGSRELLALGFFGFVMAGSQWVLLSYLALYMKDGLGLSLTAAGAALALSQATGLIGRLAWGWLSDRPGRRLAALVGVAATGLAALLVLASGVGGPGAWVAAGMAGFSLVGWNGAYLGLVADRAGAGRVGRASGHALVFIFAGVVVLPPLFGAFSDAVGAWWPIWLADATVVGISGLGLWFASWRSPSVQPSFSAGAVGQRR